jgi:FixJ family two-component response regulator
MSDHLTVFIVDDDPAVRDALSLLLGIQDYRVAVFGDAESFLKAYKSEWRGCLVLDIRMPGMDGLTLQKHLAQLGSELPVIIMTGHGDVASAREAFRRLRSISWKNRSTTASCWPRSPMPSPGSGPGWLPK